MHGDTRLLELIKHFCNIIVSDFAILFVLFLSGENGLHRKITHTGNTKGLSGSQREYMNLEVKGGGEEIAGERLELYLINTVDNTNMKF